MTLILKRNNLCIDYIRVRKEDLVKRFGFVPAVGREKREPYSTGPIIRSNRCGWFGSREYELVVQRSGPWYDVKEFLGEFPFCGGTPRMDEESFEWESDYESEDLELDSSGDESGGGGASVVLSPGAEGVPIS